MTDITAEQLAEAIRPVAYSHTDTDVLMGSLHLWQDLHGEWVGNFAGTDAADIAAMHLIRRLNARGWSVEFGRSSQSVLFTFGAPSLDQRLLYDHHPIEALARFAASRRTA